MLSLIPSIHATILSIAVAVVAVVAPIAYQRILNEKRKLSEKIRVMREVFRGPISGGGDFEEYFDSDSDEEFVEHFRTNIKNIVIYMHIEKDLDFVNKFIHEFRLLACFSSRFMDRTPFLRNEDDFDDFISADIGRYHRISSFFDDMYWMLTSKRNEFNDMINRYFDNELPRLKDDCLKMAKGEMETPDLDGGEFILKNTRWHSLTLEEINIKKAEIIFDSLVDNTISKKELSSLLDELTDKFGYCLSNVLPTLIENKQKYDEVSVLFKAKSEFSKFYTFVYSTITFGIVIPLVLNETFGFFKLNDFYFFKIISVAFVFTFIPYYIALKKIYSIINGIKL
ncbi:hypothetical protein EEAAV_18905 [Rahnella aceris]